MTWDANMMSANTFSISSYRQEGQKLQEYKRSSGPPPGLAHPSTATGKIPCPDCGKQFAPFSVLPWFMRVNLLSVFISPLNACLTLASLSHHTPNYHLLMLNCRVVNLRMWRPYQMLVVVHVLKEARFHLVHTPCLLKQCLRIMER